MNYYEHYGIYASCRDAAWRYIRDFGFDHLPVKLITAAHRMHIRVVRNSDVHELRSGEVGASIYHHGHWIIVYDDRMTTAESRMVLAHEIGHILLGHDYKYADRRFDHPTDPRRKIRSEREADMFAVRLLAPACVLHEIGVVDADAIAAQCWIPLSIAKERAARMEMLERRGKFYENPLEREACRCFSAFIHEARQRK